MNSNKQSLMLSALGGPGALPEKQMRLEGGRKITPTVPTVIQSMQGILGTIICHILSTPDTHMQKLVHTKSLCYSEQRWLQSKSHNSLGSPSKEDNGTFRERAPSWGRAASESVLLVGGTQGQGASSSLFLFCKKTHYLELAQG